MVRRRDGLLNYYVDDIDHPYRAGGPRHVRCLEQTLDMARSGEQNTGPEGQTGEAAEERSEGSREADEEVPAAQEVGAAVLPARIPETDPSRPAGWRTPGQNRTRNSTSHAYVDSGTQWCEWSCRMTDQR